MLKIRRPLGRLIFNMGIAIPGKTVFLIETAPRYFVLYATEWRQGIFCRFMEIVIATATLMSLGVSCLLIGLTTQRVANMTFGSYERGHNIIYNLFASFFIMVITQLSFMLVKKFNNIWAPNDVDICNIMGNSQLMYWTDVVSISALCIFMSVGFLCVLYSALTFCSHIMQIGKDVKKISDSLNSNTHDGKSVCNYMIVLVSIKALVTLPYPLLRIISFVHRLPEHIYLYAMLAYIISESLSNPILFVIRPLLISLRKK